MIYYKEYKKHEPLIIGKKKKIDNNIYTLDIETTSYLILNNKRIAHKTILYSFYSKSRCY